MRVFTIVAALVATVIATSSVPPVSDTTDRQADTDRHQSVCGKARSESAALIDNGIDLSSTVLSKIKDSIKETNQKAINMFKSLTKGKNKKKKKQQKGKKKRKSKSKTETPVIPIGSIASDGDAVRGDDDAKDGLVAATVDSSTRDEESSLAIVLAPTTAIVTVSVSQSNPFIGGIRA